MKTVFLTFVGVLVGGVATVALGLLLYIFLGAAITGYICCGDYPDPLWSKILIVFILITSGTLWVYTVKVFRSL